MPATQARRTSVLLSTMSDGSITAEFAGAAATLCATNPDVVGLAINEARGFLDVGRSLAVQDFLDTPFEWMWIVDSDMVLQPDTLDKLLAKANPSTCPVLAATCLNVGQSRSAPPPNDQVRTGVSAFRATTDGAGRITDLHPVDALPPDSVIRVDAVGTGCVLVHRSVLAAMKERYWPKSKGAWFMRLPDQDFGEDIAFCMRLSRMGIKVHLHTGALVGHRKPTTWWPSARHFRAPAKPMVVRSEPSAAVAAALANYHTAQTTLSADPSRS